METFEDNINEVEDQEAEHPEDEKIKSRNERANLKKSPLKIILSILFLLPALSALIFSQIIPTFRTIGMSFQEVRAFGEGVFVGWENYQSLAENHMAGQATVFTLLLTLNRVLLVLLPPLFLAFGATALKSGLRKALRIIATLPWLLYSPFALGVVWLLLTNPVFGFGGSVFNLMNPDLARWIVLGIDGLSFIGLACGVGLTVYLSALKGEGYGEDARNKPAKSMLFVAVLLVVGTLAYSLQTGGMITFMTNGGPAGMTATFNSLIMSEAFGLMRMGMAAAVATQLLVIVMVLGLVMVILMILSNFRIMAVPAKTDLVTVSKGLRIAGVILMVFALLGLLASFLPYLLKFIPLFRMPGDGPFAELAQIAEDGLFWKALLNTWWIPVVIVFLVQFPITYLAALAIGALRPLGKNSEWLLLIFAPWLFATILILIPGMTRLVMDLSLLNRLTGLSLAYLVNVPLLVVLTFFFRGQSQKYDKDENKPGFFKTYVWPSLPLAGFGIVVSVMVIQQDLVWPRAITMDPGLTMMPAFLWRLAVQRGAGVIAGVMLALRVPAFILGLIIFGASQLFIFPRLGIKSGKTGKV